MEFTKRLNLIFLGLIFFINSVIYYAKITYLYTDFGREAFYPLAITQGEVLYKDIFNMYGPFSYLFNAFMYNIIGANIHTLYIVGIISAFIILCFVYLIARNFSDKLTSTAITLVIMQSVVFSKFIMNYIQPYSYAITYGLCAMLVSIYCYIKYSNSKTSTYLGVASFFAGVAFANKYEFLFYPILLFLCLIFIHKEKKLFLPLFLFALPNLVCFLFLFKQGLTFYDLVENFKLVAKCANTDAYQYFLKNAMGFSIEGCIVSIGSIILLLILFFGTEKLCERAKNHAYLLIVPLGIILFVTKTQNFILQGLAILVTILFLVKFKEAKTSKIYLFVFICAIIFSIKSYIALIVPNGYGAYCLPLILIALIGITSISQITDDTKKSIVILLSSIALANSIMNLFLIKNRIYEINSPSGKIKNTQKAAMSYNKLLNYIQNSTNKDDKIIVLPETPLLNFLTNRKSDNYYNDFTPDRLEAYTENRIIERFKTQPPKYFIIIKIPQKPYGKGAFSEDYGTEVFQWISKNYTLEQKILDDVPVLIFKKI